MASCPQLHLPPSPRLSKLPSLPSPQAPSAPWPASCDPFRPGLFPLPAGVSSPPPRVPLPRAPPPFFVFRPLPYAGLAGRMQTYRRRPQASSLRPGCCLPCDRPPAASWRSHRPSSSPPPFGAFPASSRLPPISSSLTATPTSLQPLLIWTRGSFPCELLWRVQPWTCPHPSRRRRLRSPPRPLRSALPCGCWYRTAPCCPCQQRPSSGPPSPNHHRPLRSQLSLPSPPVPSSSSMEVYSDGPPRYPLKHFWLMTPRHGQLVLPRQMGRSEASAPSWSHPPLREIPRLAPAPPARACYAASG
mmetsp:Transcript_64385/g.188378  ORF Transcript_64385/g.188378 Transcript_64385/m.188378 type:complete len:302 (+) Transcript_64385:667-1572(+)